MSDIRKKVEAFLRADGLQVHLENNGLLYGEGRSKDGTRKRRWVWVADADGGLPQELARTLPQVFDKTLPADAKGRPEKVQEQDPWAFLVVPTLKGISGDLSRQIKTGGVTRNTLPQFFDTFYRSTNSDSYDTLHEFAELHTHLIQNRVPHRFGYPAALPRQAANQRATDPDLLVNLLDQYGELPPSARVRVVTGGAGSGKTILFNSLYAALYQRFQAHKRAVTIDVYPRPLFFLPEALRKQQGYTLDALLDAFFSTVGAAPVSPDLFNWLHREGHVLPMLDGMDEFFARQTDLFDQLSRNLEAPGSRAQLIFCVRDSLVDTNPLLGEFLERHRRSGDPRRIEVYELALWNADARRTMAWLQLENRLPESSADTQKVRRFLAQIEASPALSKLCELPLYCTLLLARFAEEEGNLPSDELELLELAIWQLVDREHIKLVGREQEEFVPLSQPLDPVSEAAAFPFDAYVLPADRADVEQLRPQYRRLSSVSVQTLEAFKKFDEVRTEFGKKGVVHLLEQVAHAYRRQTDGRGGIRGIRVDELAQLLDRHRGGEQTDGDRGFRALLILKQFAVFNAGGKQDTVDFAHEVMADFLAAGHAAEVLRSNPSACAEAFGELQVDPKSVFHKRLRQEVSLDPALEKGLADALAKREIDQPYIAYVQALLGR